MSPASHEPYWKAAGSDRLAPYYDLMVRVSMRERHVRQAILARTQLPARGSLLDVGCGTGTLALLAKERHPEARVEGVDGDATILEIARTKAKRAGSDVHFREAMATALPYDAAAFDAVTATLMLHHLSQEQQAQTLQEIRRVLRPHGRLVVADFAAPHNLLMKVLARVVHPLARLHGHHHQSHRPRAIDGLESLLLAAGFEPIIGPENFMTLAGTLAVYSADSP